MAVCLGAGAAGAGVARMARAARGSGELRLGPLVGAARGRPGRIEEAQFGASVRIYLFGLAAGPDGDLWFADLGCIGVGKCAIGRIAPGGAVRVYRRGLNHGAIPYSLAVGADGSVWFTDEGRRPAIGRVTIGSAGPVRITEFSHGLARGSQPFEIVAGPDGDLWFTDQGHRPAIGRITPAGRITEFRRGVPADSTPFGITAGRGRVLWFTDHGCAGHGRCAVGRVSVGGSVSGGSGRSRVRIAELTSGLAPGSLPLGIAAGRGGTVWFADGHGAIGRVAAGGGIIEYTRGLVPGSQPVAVAAGPDGAIWFSDESTTPAIGRITARGRIREFTRGLPEAALPAFITPAADGGMWFTDEGGAAGVGRISTGVRPALVTRPAVVPAGWGAAGVVCRPGRWAPWAGLRPSSSLYSFDGFAWLRSGVVVARGPRYAPSGSTSGLSCRETVTYPRPLLVTAVAASR